VIGWYSEALENELRSGQAGLRQLVEDRALVIRYLGAADG
jgi:hypothetical protein